MMIANWHIPVRAWLPWALGYSDLYPYPFPFEFQLRWFLMTYIFLFFFLFFSFLFFSFLFFSFLFFPFLSFPFLSFSFFNVYLFFERQSTSRGGAKRKGDTESEAGSRLGAISTGPYTGLELTDRGIMT